MTPNAGPELRLEAGATQERTLEAVSSRPGVRQGPEEDFLRELSLQGEAKKRYPHYIFTTDSSFFYLICTVALRDVKFCNAEAGTLPIITGFC